MRIFYPGFLLVFMFGVLFTGPAFAETLTLGEAVALAGQDDPALAQIEAGAQALDEKAIADGQLPDPKASLAFANFPTDNFSRSREGMTQIVVGASQAFPRGRTLAYKSKKTGAMADVQRAQFEEKQRGIESAVRQAWLELYYWQQAAHTVEHSETLLKKVIEATETNYSTGRRNAQDVIGAELELSVLQYKKVDIERQIEIARAALAKWIGQSAARRSLPKKFPALPSLMAYEKIETSLVNHPKTKMSDAMIEAGNHGVRIAQEQYKPGFGVGVNYGLRDGNLPDGDDRPDFLTAKVTFDVPLFTGKRQDKGLAASKYKAASAQYKRDDVLRNLQTMLETEHANWQRFDERAKHYDKTVIKQANENFEASLRAYQEDRTDFSSLIRAQVMELDTKLKSIRLKTDKAKAQARLLYLQGENHE